MIKSDKSTTNSSPYWVALTVLAVLYFLMGFTTVLNDTLVPFFKQGFNLTYTQSSLVQFYFYLTYGLVSIPAGKMVGKIGYKQGMIWGFCIAAFGAFLFYPAAQFHEYFLFLAALFVVAIGIVTLQVSANPYITALGSEESAASRLTLIQGVGSLGTTLAPAFGAQLILGRVNPGTDSSAVLVLPYMLIAGVLLFIGMVVQRIKLPTVSVKMENVGESLSIMALIKKYPNLKFGILALFFYVGAEVAIGTYLTNYVADLVKITEDRANIFVSYYWGGMLVGRLGGAFILRYFKTSKVLTIISGCAVFLIIGSLLSSHYTAVWLMVAVGLCNAVMFASIFSLSVKGLGSSTGRASGLLSTAIVGGAIITFLQGSLIDYASWTWAFMVPIICYLFILFYGYRLHKTAANS